MANYSRDPSGRPDSIKEALRVLDDALAAGSATFNDLVGEDFKNLRSVISGVSAGASDSFQSMSESLRNLGAQALRTISDFSERGVDGTVDSGRETWNYVDSRVRANPWPVIGGVALGAAVLGFVISQDRRSGMGRETGPRESFYSHRSLRRY